MYLSNVVWCSDANDYTTLFLPNQYIYIYIYNVWWRWGFVSVVWVDVGLCFWGASQWPSGCTWHSIKGRRPAPFQIICLVKEVKQKTWVQCGILLAQVKIRSRQPLYLDHFKGTGRQTSSNLETKHLLVWVRNIGILYAWILKQPIWTIDANENASTKWEIPITVTPSRKLNYTLTSTYTLQKLTRNNISQQEVSGVFFNTYNTLSFIAHKHINMII